MLKGMGVLMGRGMEKEWSCVGIASSSRVVVVCCGRVVVAWLCSASSLRGFVPRRHCVASFHVVVAWLRHCALACRRPGSLPCHRPVLSSRAIVVWMSVRGVRMSRDVTHQTGTMNDDQCRRSSFGCHVADGDMAPDSVRKRLFGFVGGRWRSWAVAFVVPRCGRWAPCGGCRRRRRCVVVDGRKEVCHTL